MKQSILLIAVLLLSGCSTNSLMNLARESKCITEIVKASKFTCEFEGKKVFYKGNNQPLFKSGFES